MMIPIHINQPLVYISITSETMKWLTLLVLDLDLDLSPDLLPPPAKLLSGVGPCAYPGVDP
jgi:hypothetical protein